MLMSEIYVTLPCRKRSRDRFAQAKVPHRVKVCKCKIGWNLMCPWTRRARDQTAPRRPTLVALKILPKSWTSGIVRNRQHNFPAQVTTIVTIVLPPERTPMIATAIPSKKMTNGDWESSNIIMNKDAPYLEARRSITKPSTWCARDCSSKIKLVRTTSVLLVQQPTVDFTGCQPHQSLVSRRSAML